MNVGTPKQLFEANGFIGPETLFDQSTMTNIAEQISEFISQNKLSQDWYSAVKPQNIDEQPVETIYDAHWSVEEIKKLCTNNDLIAKLSELMSTELVIWRTTFWIKEPGARRVEWHQDTYKEEQLGSFPNINAWIALDEAPENNCLWFADSTHREIIDLDQFKQPNYVEQLMSGTKLPFPPVDPETTISKMPLQPGQCVIFDGRTLHGSPPNLSDKRRAGLVIRFIPKDYVLQGYNGKLMDSQGNEVKNKAV
ncbi:phytanoyl-CoA dioxygenase family protein [Neptuniibacter sp.]|uniref:phytanoyl-CoA dioxygenase family protein n=1 Tax=Neptuniibacter sp. TaxID=1962643 RepID=UPI002607CE47|nr:phytanoyl-CoA dioxygenase family protein [Neptuniibacter sp.]MCP4596862.1 hypothetical protein [Neptuniibacter sp.]